MEPRPEAPWGVDRVAPGSLWTGKVGLRMDIGVERSRLTEEVQAGEEEPDGGYTEEAATGGEESMGRFRMRRSR